MGRTKPVEIFGEPRIQEFVLLNHKILNFNLNYQVIIHVIKNEGILVNEKDYCIKACFADHSILSYSFLVEEYDRPGKFDIEKARKYGIPEGELYQLLQHGIDIEYDGRRLYAKEFTGPSRSARKIGISGDTRPTIRLQQFFTGCDVLIFESTFLSIEQQKAAERFHSTALEAALFAKKAKVKKLILTHFSSRYDDLNLLKEEAIKTFENVHIAYELEIIDVQYPG
jgi:ribonuclease Z